MRLSFLMVNIVEKVVSDIVADIVQVERCKKLFKASCLVNEKLTTNQDYANWILNVRKEGFINFSSIKNKENDELFQKIQKEEKVGKFETGKESEKIMPALIIMHAIIKNHISNWIMNNGTQQAIFTLGSFIRDIKGYHAGNAIDINMREHPFDPTPEVLEDILNSLPEGCYGIGLPFHPDFFPIGHKLRKYLPPPDTDKEKGEIEELPEQEALIKAHKAFEELKKECEKKEETAGKTWKNLQEKNDDVKKKIENLKIAQEELKNSNNSERQKKEDKVNTAKEEVESVKPEEQKEFEKTQMETQKAKEKAEGAQQALVAKKEGLKGEKKDGGLQLFASTQFGYTYYELSHQWSDAKQTEERAINLIPSEKCKKIFEDIPKERKLELVVFPDNPRHIHIDKR